MIERVFSNEAADICVPPLHVLRPAGPVSIDVFGVFDGHGGKQAATYASRNLTDKLLAVIKDKEIAALKDEESEAQQLLQDFDGIDAKLRTTWESQDRLLSGLPECLVETFHQLQHDFFQQAKVGPLSMHSCRGWNIEILQ